MRYSFLIMCCLVFMKVLIRKKRKRCVCYYYYKFSIYGMLLQEIIMFFDLFLKIVTCKCINYGFFKSQDFNFSYYFNLFCSIYIFCYDNSYRSLNYQEIIFVCYIKQILNFRYRFFYIVSWWFIYVVYIGYLIIVLGVFDVF